MANSTANTRDTASKRRAPGRIGNRNCLRILLAGALLLAATNSVAGLLSSPLMGGLYANPELATVSIRTIGDDLVQVRSHGLAGELGVDAGDAAPGSDATASGSTGFPFDQRLELVVNLSLGVVEGYTSGQIATANAVLEYRADVRGNATCIPLNGLDCGQLVVELESNGAISDPYDPASAGRIRMVTLGSLVWFGDAQGSWAAMSANAILAVNEALLASMTPLAGGDPAGTLTEFAVGYEADDTLEGNDWFWQPPTAGTLTELAVGYDVDEDLEGNDWFWQPPEPLSSAN